MAEPMSDERLAELETLALRMDGRIGGLTFPTPGDAREMLAEIRRAREEMTEEWGVLRDVFTPRGSRESATREVHRQRTGKWPLPARLARRYVTQPEEVPDA